MNARELEMDDDEDLDDEDFDEDFDDDDLDDEDFDDEDDDDSWRINLFFPFFLFIPFLNICLQFI